MFKKTLIGIKMFICYKSRIFPLTLRHEVTQKKAIKHGKVCVYMAQSASII